MSRNRKGFWRALDLLAGGAVMAEWARELGDELGRAQPLLRLLPGLAASHPCMNMLGCGEPHRAEEIEPGRWEAVCSPEVSCPPFRLERKDLFVFGLDTARLCSRIAMALGLGAVNGRKPGQVRAEVVGAYGGAGWPMYLMLPGDSARMMREVERLFGAQPDPFVLLTPTGVHCSPDVETMLRRQCCMHIALSSAMVLGPGGALTAAAAVGPLLAEFVRRQAERPKVAPLLEGLHRKIDAGHAERAELRVAKARLEQIVAEGLLKFLGRVDAQSLRVVYAVLAKGDIAKAARELKMKDSTLREFVAKWMDKGKDYAVLADLVRWRKDTKFTGTVPFSEEVFASEAGNVDYRALIADVLDGLLTMTEGNWEDKREELAQLLRPVAA
jgi:hypothetical protein